MSAKRTVNNKLQGSVAMYLKCGGLDDNQIKKGLLLSLSLKKILKSVNIRQSYRQERDCLVHFLRLLAVYWPGAQKTPVVLFVPCGSVGRRYRCVFEGLDPV